MATVVRSRRRYRVAVNSNDHLPQHVHVFGKGCEARFKLNCPEGPVVFWDCEGGLEPVPSERIGRRDR